MQRREGKSCCEVTLDSISFRVRVRSVRGVCKSIFTFDCIKRCVVEIVGRCICGDSDVVSRLRWVRTVGIQVVF
jgi:hypothetical protein